MPVKLNGGFVTIRQNSTKLFRKEKAMKATLLTREQIDVKNQDSALETMKNSCLRFPPISDFARLSGGFPSWARKTSDGKPTAFDLWLEGPYILNQYNSPEGIVSPNVSSGIRPVLNADEVASINPNDIKRAGNIEGFETVFYGEFPQSVEINEKTVRFLNECSKELFGTPGYGEVKTNGLLKETGKNYSLLINGKKKELKEYTYNGEKYIRIFSCTDYDYKKLFGYEENDLYDVRPYWIKVELIEWVKDPSGVWFTKQALLGNVSYGEKQKVLNDFSKVAFSQYEHNQEKVIEQRLDKIEKRKEVFTERTAGKFLLSADSTTHDSNSSSSLRPNGRDDGGR